VTAAAGAPPAAGANKWIVAVSTMMATILVILDVTIANVALDHMRGSLSAAVDEITWVLTSFLIANAISLPITGWLTDLLGRKRLFIVAQGGVIRGLRHAEALRQPAIEQASALEFVEPRQIADLLKPEMHQEGVGRAIGDRPARRFAAAAQPDPAGVEQHVERALGNGDAANLFDLGAGRRLVIGDDRQRLQRRAGELFLLDLLACENPVEVGGGTKKPLLADAGEIDAAARIMGAQPLKNALEVGALLDAARHFRFIKRLGGGEKQRLDDALRFAQPSLVTRKLVVAVHVKKFDLLRSLRHHASS